MANPQNFITHIRNLVAKDDFSRAIQKLSTLLKDSLHLDEAIQQSARYFVCKVGRNIFKEKEYS